MKPTENLKPDAGVLKRFMQEFFPYRECKKIGLFTAEMRGDYEAQAARICQWFGYETVYEYGAKEIRCHISPVNPDPKEPFITVVPSIYD